MAAPDPYSPEVQFQRRASMRFAIISGFILLLAMTGKKAKERADEKARAKESSQEETPSPASSEQPRSTHPKTFKDGARTRVPRPPLPTRSDNPAESPEVSEEPAEAPSDPQQASRKAEVRDTADLDAPLREALQASTEAVLPDVKNCLQEWWMLDPNLEGSVQVEVVLNEDGLKEVQILDHTNVPMGPLSCFGTALYDADWPNVADEVTVVLPFRFEN